MARPRRSSKQMSAPERFGHASTMSQPASARTSTARWVAARTSGSRGRSPRSAENATRGMWVAGVADTSTPVMAPSRRATSATVRPIGPDVGIWILWSTATSCGMDREVGRSPTTPLKDAGLRRDPPRSDPSATDTDPQARATAAPPLEPPALSAGFHGLRVRPCTGLKVWEPAPNSGVLVLPTVMRPHRRRCATRGASTSGKWSAKIGEP